MSELHFSTGVREYTINDVCTVHFNPTDSYFVERLYNTFEALDKKQEKFRAQIDGMTDNREIFRVSRAMDEEMRADVNAVFGKDVCGELFPDMNVYAMADGLPGYLQNVREIKEALAASTRLPATMDRSAYTDWNNIERLLLEAEELLQNMIAGYVYCGELYTGEEFNGD